MRGQQQSGTRRLNRHWQSGRNMPPHHITYEYISKQYDFLENFIFTENFTVPTHGDQYVTVGYHFNSDVYIQLPHNYYVGSSPHNIPPGQAIPTEMFLNFSIVADPKLNTQNTIYVQSPASGQEVDSSAVLGGGNLTQYFTTEIDPIYSGAFGRVNLQYKNPRSHPGAGIYSEYNGNIIHIILDFDINLRIYQSGGNGRIDFYLDNVGGWIRT